MTHHTPASSTPFRHRAAVALGVGLISGALSYAFLARPGFASDFFHFWAAAQTVLAGGNPYTSIVVSKLNPGGDPFLYPLPAVFFILPVAWLPLPAAGGVFVGCSSALLALVLFRDGYARAPLFMSAPFLMAVSLGQWSPLLVAAALEPRLGFACAAKPNLGLASWMYRPSWMAVFSSAGLTIASLVVLPTWPVDWLRAIADRPEKFSPMFSVAGPLLALAALRWRLAETRLFLTLAVVPQALLFYDQLALWLIPKTLRESLLFSLASFVLLLAWFHNIEPGDFYVRDAIPYVLALYVPALIMILRRPSGSRRRQASDHVVPEPPVAETPA